MVFTNGKFCRGLRTGCICGFFEQKKREGGEGKDRRIWVKNFDSVVHTDSPPRLVLGKLYMIVSMVGLGNTR